MDGGKTQRLALLYENHWITNPQRDFAFECDGPSDGNKTEPSGCGVLFVELHCTLPVSTGADHDAVVFAPRS